MTTISTRSSRKHNRSLLNYVPVCHQEDVELRYGGRHGFWRCSVLAAEGRCRDGLLLIESESATGLGVQHVNGVNDYGELRGALDVSMDIES